jgi:nucleotide-binding universal stress UspA family protein
MTTLANRETILVGIDGSDTSIGAAHWAADLAERLNAPMLLVSVVGSTNYYYFGLSYPDFTEELRAVADSTLARVQAGINERHPTLQVAAKAYSGAADIVLIELSATARMTVVGAHGHNTADAMLMGSIALRVANHAHSPVTVWRAHPTPESGAVLVGVDGTPASMAAVDQAYELASLLDTGLIALHSWLTDEDEGTALLSECLAGKAEQYPDVKVEQIVEDSNPATALLQWSANARLVVVGSHGRGRAMATLLGSTSQNLLHRIAVPLVICRAGQER